VFRKALLLGLFGGLDADARTLVAAMSVAPSSGRAQLISTTIKALKAAGLWTLIDALYLTAAHDSQAALLNWKNPGTWTLAPTNSPTFTVDRGYQGDGATSYLSATGYNPSTAGGAYAQDSALIGAWMHQATTVSGSFEAAIGNGTARIGTNAGPSTYATRVNDATGMNASPATLTAAHWAGRRLSSAGKDMWRNGVQYMATDVSASTAVTATFRLLANSNPGGFSNGRIAAAYTGGGLTDVQMAAMHAVLFAYMQGVGVV
jgi:hypothetical protein